MFEKGKPGFSLLGRVLESYYPLIKNEFFSMNMRVGKYYLFGMVLL